jgi:WD40 repeat protein
MPGDYAMTDGARPSRNRRHVSTALGRLFGKPCMKQYLLWTLAGALWIAIFFGLWHLVPVLPKKTLEVGGEAPWLEAFLPEGRIVFMKYSAADDRRPPIQLWDSKIGQRVISLPVDLRHVREIMASPDGSVFTTLDSHTDLRMWEAATGKEISEFVAFQKNADCTGERAARFSPDGRFLIVSSFKEGKGPFLLFWEVGARKLRLRPRARLSDLTIADNGQQMSIHRLVEDQPHIKVECWLLDADFPNRGPYQVHDVIAHDVAISPKFDVFASARGNADPNKGDDIQLWDMETGREIANAVSPFLHYYVRFSPNGRYLSHQCFRGSRGQPGPGPLWDTKAGLKEVHNFADLMHISADDRWLLAKPEPMGERVELFDTRTFQAQGEISTPPGSFRWGEDRCDFAPDSKTLLVKGMTWHDNGNAFTDFVGNYIPAFKPRDEKVVWLFDVETAKEIGAFVDCFQALYSPDGKTLATSHGDGTIKVWDIPPRKPVFQIVGVSLVLWLSVIVGLQIWRRLLGWWLSPKLCTKRVTS